MNTKSKKDVTYRIHSKIDQVSMMEKQEVGDFLFEHLGEYGDAKDDILSAIDYAVGEHPYKGGFLVLARKDERIVGAVVLNQTNMSGYIPSYILVYIAVDADQRGQGIGKQLMIRSLDLAKGDVALHVEPDNPARKLYEKMGFTNKYLEMRFTREK